MRQDDPRDGSARARGEFDQALARPPRLEATIHLIVRTRVDGLRVARVTGG